MFYYLLYNSSFSFIVDNRLFSTILYGSILYILTHAILNYCKVEILEIINNYFWFIFILDIAALAFGIYQNLSSSSPTIANANANASANANADGSASNNLDVSFNLLKNKINTISTYFNKKNDISITENIHVPTPRQPLRIATSHSPNSHLPHATTSQSIQSRRQQQQQQQQQQKNGFSTPITALRDLDQMAPNRNTAVSHIPSPIIMDDIDLEYGCDNSSENVSVAGSDVGSIMDLEEFERSL